MELCPVALQCTFFQTKRPLLDQNPWLNFSTGMQLFAYSWRLPAFSGAFAYKCVWELSYLEFELLAAFSVFLLTIELFVCYGKAHLMTTSRNCKQKEAQLLAKELSLSVKKLPPYFQHSCLLSLDVRECYKFFSEHTIFSQTQGTLSKLSLIGFGQNVSVKAGPMKNRTGLFGVFSLGKYRRCTHSVRHDITNSPTF